MSDINKPEEKDINDPSMNIDPVIENKNDNDDKKKKKTNKYPIYIGIILIITAVVLYFSLRDNFDQTIEIFSKIDPINLIYGISCFAGSFLIDCVILYLFARRYRKKYYYHQAVANGLVGIFYNDVTPGQSGGQIMQAYTFKKQGISISNATSCLVMNFIVYQFVLIIYGIFALCMKFNNLMAMDPINIEINGATFLTIPIWLLTILGFILDVSVIGLTFLMSYSKHFHNFILNHGINILAKMHIIKNPEDKRRKLGVQVESFKLELKNLFTNPIFLLVILVLHIASFTFKFMVPFYIGHAILGAKEVAGAYSYSIIDTIVYGGFQKLVVELIPIPGSAGIAEYIFYTLFSPAFSANQGYSVIGLANSLQIIWRTITFHFPLIVSGVVCAFYKGKAKDEYVSASSTTYIDLQMETITERRNNYETMYATKMLNRKEFDKKRKGLFHKNDEKDNK